MQTCKGGRGNKASPAQKQASMDWHKERVRISNLIARKPEIKKICCICGKPGKILHNRKDPYCIAFICDNCKKNPDNLKEAENHRFDIREHLKESTLCIHNYNDDQIKDIVEGYKNSTISIGDYCKQINISRYQFNEALKRYNKLYPNKHMSNIIKGRAIMVQRNKLQNIKDEKLF